MFKVVQVIITTITIPYDVFTSITEQFGIPGVVSNLLFGLAILTVGIGIIFLIINFWRGGGKL